MGSRYSLLSGRRERAAIAFVAVVALAGALVPAAASANVASPAPSADAATPTPQEGETAAPAEDTPEPEPAADATPDPTPSATPSTAPSPEATDAPAPEPTEDSAVPLAGADYEGDSTPDEADPAGNGAGPDHGQMKTRSLVGFRPGNIITDEVMYSSGTMSTAEIQSFLNLKVPTCRSGYVCLKDFRQTTSTRAATSWCPGTYQGASNESAAQIISKVSRACGVSEKVLLVMLQKEQGLVTHTWPSDWRYTIAMGYACPDNADCDTAFYGFSYQVYMAASQLKRYTLDSWFNWFPVGRTSNVLWHPNASCGSAPVLIENAATAALYYYTPYQPNQASLAAGYGEGDACSSYGNRNFYNYYTDWFGSTREAGGQQKPTVASLNATSHLLAVDGGGTMWAYPSDGRGGWAERVEVGSGWGGYSQVLGVGDLDGDGNRDIVPVEASGAAWLHRGDGKLGFRGRTPLNVDWSGAGLIVNAGDFDGDGIPDVFTRAPNGDLLLWRGADGGSFRAPKVVGWRWNGMNLVIGAGDMTGDGNADVIARRTDGALFLYRGDGKGRWLGSTQIGHGWRSMSGIFAPGDFNGDGKSDLLGLTATGEVNLYTNLGDGRVTSAGRIGHGWRGFTKITSAGPVASGAIRPFHAGMGDVDGDGNRDVLALTNAGELRLYPGDGSGGWQTTRTVATSWSTADHTFSIGDFTGNGVGDVGRVTESGRLYVYPGRGDGTFGDRLHVTNGLPPNGLFIGGMDFNNDRSVDLIVRDGAGTLRLYRNNGSGGLQSGYEEIGWRWGSMSAIFYAGDFDGDGLGDLIARTADGTLKLYPSNGAGGWKPAREIGWNWNGLKRLFSPGDFDGDGNADVIGVNGNQQLVLYRGDGGGGWNGSRVIGYNWRSMSWIG
ncbi:FG-GAP-like repeat-containing protein [Microbacterium sp. NPDC003461]